MKLVNIGFGNMVNASRVITVISPDSNPVKRMVGISKQKNMLIDATQGRKTKSVIVMDSDHIILSYLSVETVMDKFNGKSEEL